MLADAMVALKAGKKAAHLEESLAGRKDGR